MSGRENTTLNEAFASVQKVAQRLNLPSHVCEEACQMFRRCLARELVRGRSVNEVVAACVYAATRRSNSPARIQDIASSLSLKKKVVARCYRLILGELELNVPLPDPSLVLEQMGKKLALDGVTLVNAKEILQKAHSANATLGKDPAGLAAAAIYEVSRQLENRPTQKELALMAGVTEVTVRNRCRSLEDAILRASRK